MTISIKRLLGVTAIVSLGGLLVAGNTAAAELEATARATILPPVQLTENVELNFGTVGVEDDGVEATYTIDAETGTDTAVNLQVLDPAVRGEFTVSGREGENVVVTFDNVDFLLTCQAGGDCAEGVDTVAVEGLETGATNIFALTDTPNGLRASANFFVGALLRIAAGTEGGEYVGSYTVIANYE